jgi:hypothetical protein
MRPVAMVPTSWSEPAGPIVGDDAKHRTLRAWLGDTGLQRQATPIKTETAGALARTTAGSFG